MALHRSDRDTVHADWANRQNLSHSGRVVSVGTLKHSGSGRITRLTPRHLVGRAARCDLLMNDPRVSAEHAVVAWDNGWQVRDLGSKNGTFVDGQQVAVGEPVALRVESKVSFGGLRDPWVLENDAPPAPSATNPDDQRVIGGSGILALPSADEPVVSLFRDAAGRWVAEGPLGREPALDGQRLMVEGVPWQLSLPEALAMTSGPDNLSLSDCALRMAVSLDEEHVTATLDGPQGSIDLGTRTHLYLLVTLARERLSDAEASVEESAQGWVYQDDLARNLGVTASLLNIHVHRARSQLAALGVYDAAALVERRPAAKQLRIGLADLTITRI